MRHLILFVFIFLWSSAPVIAGDEVKRGMEAFKLNKYEAATEIFYSSLSSGGTSGVGTAQIGLGMAALENAKLYKELYRLSLAYHLDYLKRLSSTSGKERSRFAGLYMGEALLEAGRPKEAMVYLRKFIADKRSKAKYKNIAKTGLGLAYYLQGNKKKALSIWSGVKKRDPEALSELAYAYYRAGLKGKDSVAMSKKALESLKKSGGKPSPRIVKNVLGIYAAKGLIDEGFGLIKLVDIRSHSYEEVLGKNKVIRFYNPALLNALSGFYGKVSLKYLKKASLDKKLKDVASFHLAEALSFMNRFDESKEVIGSFISSSRMPEKFKNRARARLVANSFRKGSKSGVVTDMNVLLKGGRVSPGLIAEVLLACGRLGVKCDEAVSKGATVSEAGEGKRFAPVNFALGRYYLLNKDYNKAVIYMEAGRDKSNKNRIEYNAPLLLVSLSEAYYERKQFSEALEVYFEMSKQFPAVRQVQVVLQGLYSIEQKSAGDVKIL